MGRFRTHERSSTILIFGKPVAFYLFDLPFWSDLRTYIFTIVIIHAILVYWLVARGWQLRFNLPDIARRRNIRSFHPAPFGWPRIKISFALRARDLSL